MMKLFCSLLALAMPALAVEVLQQPNPLSAAWLSVPDTTKARLRSGFDYNDGNMDSGNLVRVEPAGASFTNAGSAWVLFESDGPGVITSIWLTGKSKQGQARIGGRLNFIFDGEETPRFSGRLPELFESGALLPHPLAERSSGGWVSYVPIYFSKSLKITLTEHDDGFTHRQNARGETIPHIYHQFSWQRLSTPARSTHATDLASAPCWQIDERGKRGERRVDLPTGQRTVVFAAEGQGILNRLKLRWIDADPDAAWLRVIADGRTNVDLAMPEFLGFARRSRPAAHFESLLLGVDAQGVAYCCFPMPHRESLTVEIENRGVAGKLAVETTHLPSWFEPDHLYFHATRVTDKMERGRDLNLLGVAGRGHFVGTILELPDGTLEGDDRFYVDGEPFPPAWHGTGTEDYFRCGWYFHGGALTRALYGLLDNAKPKIAYRFHLADRVNFMNSVVIGFEHGHGNRFLGPIRGVVFWYAR